MRIENIAVSDLRRCGILICCMLASLMALAQVNPQKGYIITNGNDTIHGTIDYLTDAQNARACLFCGKGEHEYKSLSPADIKGYRLAGDGIYYVSRLFNGGEKPQLLFAEFLLQGGVSLYRYYYDDINYFGFVDTEGKEVIIQDDKLNNDLSTYNAKLQERRQKVQEVNALMSRDNTIANRLWKMDLTSHELTNLVKQYDEKYCTNEGECVVFQYDQKKASAVSRRFYVGAGISYASYEAPKYTDRSNHLFSGNTYNGVAPVLFAGADFLFPRLSKYFMAQMEFSYTPHRYKASKEMFEGGDPKMSIDELAARVGAKYVLCPGGRIRPFIEGGLHFAWNMGIKEQNVSFRYNNGEEVQQKTGDLNYDNETRLGVYLGAGVDISHIRISAFWKKAKSSFNGLNEKNSGLLTVAYLFK